MPSISVAVIFGVTAFLFGCYPFYLLELGAPQWLKRQSSKPHAWGIVLKSVFAFAGYALLFYVTGLLSFTIFWYFSVVIQVMGFALDAASPQLFVFAMGFWMLAGRIGHQRPTAWVLFLMLPSVASVAAFRAAMSVTAFNAGLSLFYLYVFFLICELLMLVPAIIFAHLLSGVYSLWMRSKDSRMRFATLSMRYLSKLLDRAEKFSNRETAIKVGSYLAILHLLVHANRYFEYSRWGFSRLYSTVLWPDLPLNFLFPFFSSLIQNTRATMVLELAIGAGYWYAIGFWLIRLLKIPFIQAVKVRFGEDGWDGSRALSALGILSLLLMTFISCYEISGSGRVLTGASATQLAVITAIIGILFIDSARQRLFRNNSLMQLCASLILLPMLAPSFFNKLSVQSWQRPLTLLIVLLLLPILLTVSGVLKVTRDFGLILRQES